MGKEIQELTLFPAPVIHLRQQVALLVLFSTSVSVLAALSEIITYRERLQCLLRQNTEQMEPSVRYLPIMSDAPNAVCPDEPMASATLLYTQPMMFMFTVLPYERGEIKPNTFTSHINSKEHYSQTVPELLQKVVNGCKSTPD